MASTTETDSTRPRVLEWPWPNVGRGTIINRSVGCPSTVCIMFAYPDPSSFDTERLPARIAEVQDLWPLLCITVVDQRTTTPKIRYDYSTWRTDQVLFNETYEPNPNDRKAERDGVFDRALRSIGSTNSYGEDPLWNVRVYRAASNPESNRMFVAVVFDHVIIDGEGSLRLADAIVAKDISGLPRESIELYTKVGLGQHNNQLPPYSYIASAMLTNALSSVVPTFAQKALGMEKTPVWPQSVRRPTVDSPWKSRIADFPPELSKKLKEVGVRRGVSSIGPTMHAAWIATLWAVFLRPEQSTQRQAITDLSLKNLRDVSKGDPYCLGGHVTLYVWSSGPLSDTSSFWGIAESYQERGRNPRFAEDAVNMMRMGNLFKDRAVDPEKNKHRAPEHPPGDKRAHTLFEEMTLARANSLSPYGGMSGVWTNVQFRKMPEGAVDMLAGLSGSAAGPGVLAVVMGHKAGLRMQLVFCDGAVMTEESAEQVEKLYAATLERLVSEGDRNWTIGELVSSIRARL